MNAGTAQSVAATNQVFHDIVGNLGDKYSELARDVAGVNMAVQQSIANQNECCCSTKMMMQEMKQEILSKMDADKIESLQNQINQLQLQQAVAGVVRYPMASTYNSGSNPFCGCGCGNV